MSADAITFHDAHPGTANLREEVLAELDRPPRLPAFWTGMRRVLGLEGKPNV